MGMAMAMGMAMHVSEQSRLLYMYYVCPHQAGIIMTKSDRAEPSRPLSAIRNQKPSQSIKEEEEALALLSSTIEAHLSRGSHVECRASSLSQKPQDKR